MNRHKNWELTPNQILFLYYGLFVFLGTVTLALPIAAQGEAISFFDAFFTASSALCDNGLVVVDTGSRFSLFGQMVVLALVQMGGLGITTFSVYFFFSMHREIIIQKRWLVQETLLHTPVNSLINLLGDVFVLTILVESVGAVFLAFQFVPDLGWPQGIFSAVFHSVAAFCNAGFSLFPDKLVRYRANPLVNVTIMGLIILGGLGFLVLCDIAGFFKHGRTRRRLSLHSRLTLLTTVILTVGGALLLGIFEWESAMGRMEVMERFWAVLFQSISARTAGLTTVDLNTFRVPSLFLIILLMFIGASPGSCGGGIKTTSLAVFFAVLVSRLKGSPRTNVFGRTIPDELATKTLTLIILASIVVAGGTFGLLAVQLEGESLYANQGTFMNYLFEAVSAFGSVGLSLGITPSLNNTGRIMIILLMFLGRVGLLAVAFSILKRTRNNGICYAEENIMIG